MAGQPERDLARPLKRPQVENTARFGILQDIDHIISRVSKALRGDVKFLDARTRVCAKAITNLQVAKDLLQVGLIPTNQE